eukprot:4443797-Pleurochrysis_carterae.AAC.1
MIWNIRDALHRASHQLTLSVRRNGKYGKSAYLVAYFNGPASMRAARLACWLGSRPEERALQSRKATALKRPAQFRSAL